MVDRNKVIKGLECCKWSRQNVKPEKNKCDECPYRDQDIMSAFVVWKSCTNVLARDAISLLKEQEQTIEDLKERLRLLDYANHYPTQDILMPAT